MTDTLHTVADSISQAAGAHGKSGGDWIMHHILDGNVLDFRPIIPTEIHLPTLHLLGYALPITKHTVYMWLVAVLLILVLRSAAKKYKKSMVPSGAQNLLEIIIIFVRDEIAKSTIGKGYEKFLPYLLTAFFFILFSNFLGLLPYSATVTSNITVTAVLATLSFIMIQFGGMRKNGVFGYLKGLIPHGIPWIFVPVIGVVEIIGLFTKPFALAIRLFANMTAGHIVIYALFSLIFVMQSYAIAFSLSIPLALFVYFLEILVALLQAYIFTMLSSLFIGMAVHQDH